jgi:hypothetical protein
LEGKMIKAQRVEKLLEKIERVVEAALSVIEERAEEQAREEAGENGAGVLPFTHDEDGALLDVSESVGLTNALKSAFSGRRPRLRAAITYSKLDSDDLHELRLRLHALLARTEEVRGKPHDGVFLLYRWFVDWAHLPKIAPKRMDVDGWRAMLKEVWKSRSLQPPPEDF